MERSTRAPGLTHRPLERALRGRRTVYANHDAVGPFDHLQDLTRCTSTEQRALVVWNSLIARAFQTRLMFISEGKIALLLLERVETQNSV